MHQIDQKTILQQRKKIVRLVLVLSWGDSTWWGGGKIVKNLPWTYSVRRTISVERLARSLDTDRQRDILLLLYKDLQTFSPTNQHIN